MQGNRLILRASLASISAPRRASPGRGGGGRKEHVSALDDIRNQLPDFRERLGPLREILLANLVMTSEIPAPTFGEETRAQFMLQRFAEVGLIQASMDEAGNAVGLVPGVSGGRAIVVAAHLDTLFDAKTDHDVTLLPDRAAGVGLGDNSLGAAMTLSLPRLLDTLGVKLESDLLVLGAARSLGYGNLEGLRFFLAHRPEPLRAGLCVEGVPLGRLSFASLSMLRGEIRCQVPEDYDWTRFGASGAIAILHEALDKILGIPLPRKPRTDLVLGSIQGGNSFNRIATEARLRFEVRSEDDDIVSSIEQRIQNIAKDIAGTTRAEVAFELVARSRAGGLPYDHPLVQSARDIMAALHIEPRVSPSSSDLAAFTDAGLPALTLGLTRAAPSRPPQDAIELEPVFTGLVQLLGVLLAIDRGCCDV